MEKEKGIDYCGESRVGQIMKFNVAKEGKGRESKYQHRVFKEEDDKWII